MTQIQSPRSVSAGATGTKHALEFDDDASLPMYYGAQGNTQLHFSSMHVCGGQFAVPNPRHALDLQAARGPRNARAARRCAPCGQNADDWGDETLTAVPTGGPRCEERDGWPTAGKSVVVPALAVVAPSPLLVSHNNYNEAGTVEKSAIKGGFTSFARAKNADAQPLCIQQPPFFFLFFLFFFLFLLFICTFLAASHDPLYGVVILLLPRALGEVKAGPASE